ncbi:xyloglucan O-acetyltransferase 2-like [Phragmites australis]|uniref:xyloglucan O-acetyltransferase 2-like n=1 Tax=Phragmites australis TaxID=29695 RepID=UPI002D793110|nr:xyloglucan O-acetyltransferase 2-like [Phragmites australis]
MGSYQPLYQNGHKPSSSPANGVGPGHFHQRTGFTWLLCTVLCLSLLHLLCSPPPASHETVVAPVLQHIAITSGSDQGKRSCDYSEGQWVREPGYARRYNGTECNVKDSENCVRNGRPDTGYLDWRWQPAAAGCRLPAFDAGAFLAAVRGKHVAFIGDSMARNQAESLVCLLGASSSSSFPYRLVYRDPEPRTRKFWRWAFPSHNVTVSVYWAPFLARATGKSEDYSMPHNTVYLNSLAERWSADADTMDVAVISTGHWFWNPTIYCNGSVVLGTHLLPMFNYTNIGLFSPYREAIRMSIQRLIGSGRGGAGRTVVVATISPAHFEKAWNDPTTCARTEPYKDGEKEVETLAAELRRIAREEADAAAARSGGDGSGETRVMVLDVTKLASMRPDGHPGVYMHRDPFARGVPEQLQSDCLHFCLPGPVDTFNEILLQILTKNQ